MRCADIQALIEEYYDGELDVDLAASIQLHLGTCSECSEVLASLQAEQRLFRGFRESFERQLQVPPQIWSGVKAGISANESNYRIFESKKLPKDRPRFSLFGGASWLPQLGYAVLLVVISVAATLFYVRYRGRDAGHETALHTEGQSVPAKRNSSGTSPAALPMGGDQPAEKSLEAAVRAIHRAELEYQEAIQLLSGIVDKRKSSLQAGLVREMERNIKSIDESIDATRKAYYANPSDPYLAQYMLAAYSKKVELLQELAS